MATMVSVGLTTAVPGVGLRMASADSAKDQALQDSVGNEFFRVDWTAKPDGHGNARISGAHISITINWYHHGCA